MLSLINDVLRELIAIPSVNPRLATAAEPSGEAQLTKWLIGYAERAGWRWTLQPVHPGRENFLAIVPGNRGDTLLWEAHQDTVSTHGMTVEPFRASVADGRAYGRGACDVKGPMAAMLAALTRASLESPRDRPNVLLACTVNEECGFSGARALAEIWREKESRESTADSLTFDELQKLRPAAAIVAEPTELNVVVAHRGVVRWQCTVHGRAAHSSRPEDGANAIYAMAHIVRLVEKYHRDELAARPADSQCGPATACVTTIRGGTGANTVPDRVIIDIDRRLPPNEEPETAYHELVEFVEQRAALGGCRVEHAAPWMQSRGLAAGANLALAEQVASVARATGLTSELVGVPYGTNAASIAVAGIPTVVFGPGSIAQAHTADEWIAVEQLEQAAEVFYRVAMGAVRLEA